MLKEKCLSDVLFFLLPGPKLNFAKFALELKDTSVRKITVNMFQY